MKLEDITQDIILENYSLKLCDKLASKSVVYYAYNAPRYGETDIDKCRLYVNKMKLVIKTLNQMKTLITITLLFITISLSAQTKFKQEQDSLRALPGMREVFQFQFVKLKTIKELRFSGLNDREKWLLLDQIEDAYFKFNNGRKQVEPSLLLAFMESENPVCKWSGLYEEVEDKHLVKVYKVDMKIILQIFDL